MKTTTGTTIRLADYQAPPFWIETVDLAFHLHPTKTRVKSVIHFTANETRADGPHDLRLDGRNLTLISAAIDGRTLGDEEILHDAEGLTVPHDLVPQGGFTWEAEVEINPQANTALEGLYMSNGMYCTQCEAQGFRKITYYLDRPDVMARFTTRIFGTLAETPTLLSNGNGELYEADHTLDKPTCNAVWIDPWPKPAYLFALVAGDLATVEDRFTTASGREVVLEIHVRPGDEGKCDYAMDALKRSMRWDEEVYGREYDLDIFQIVAVDDFNMGAMENKGLNIFNSKYVLASPETATDRDYELIEGIIAHEYFHNWTGNRITCRDWFQLCLKEGLTVFRDQQFSGDERGHAVKRIDDVSALRGRQFREDAGPLAHPVRPEEYIEINNFYTATVYEKGAEVIRMLKILVGDDGYKKALDLYFDRHDGQACTIEDWIKVFEDACETNLTQFARWYAQAGTPIVHVDEVFEDGTYKLNLRQEIKPTPGQNKKAPAVIPIEFGLIGDDGKDVESGLWVLDKAEDSRSFDLAQKPVASLLRGFSAPVILNHTPSRAERLHLLAHDSDTFNRWDTSLGLAREVIVEMLNGADPDADFLAAKAKIARDKTLDPAYRSEMMSLPSEEEMARHLFSNSDTPDPDAIFATTEKLANALAETLGDDLRKIYDSMAQSGPYTPDATSAGKRALRNTALARLTRLEADAATAKAQFANSDNMTEQLSSFGILIRAGQGADAAAAFYDQWKEDKLVMDKWFAVQLGQAAPETALDMAQKLSEHPDFNWKNPNRFRSLIGPFAMNHAGFHRADGKGYEFLADWLIKLDDLNPQTTARICGLFETWKRYDADRQGKIKAQLERIQGKKKLSKDTSEIIGKILSA